MKKSIIYLAILLLCISCSSGTSYKYFDINEVVDLKDTEKEFEATWSGEIAGEKLESDIKINFDPFWTDLKPLQELGQERTDKAIDAFLNAIPSNVPETVNILTYEPKVVQFLPDGIYINKDGETEVYFYVIFKANTLLGEMLLEAQGTVIDGEEVDMWTDIYQQ